jgi:hypothetical protein
MPAEQRGQVIAVEHGPTGLNREEPEISAEGGSLPKPFVWTKSANEILEKVARAKQALESQH